jgi:hypothetical protein
LDNNLVIITDILKKKRKKGGKVNQVYYVTECGLTKHASFFSKINKEDILQIKRDLKLQKLGI